MTRILLVEDNNGFIPQMLFKAYAGETTEIILAIRGEDAVRKLYDNDFDGIILDLQLPGVDGFAVLQAVQKIDPSIPVVILSANGHKANQERAKRLGAGGFFVKPPDHFKVWICLSGLIAKRQAGRLPTQPLTAGNVERLAKHRRLLKLKEQAARMGINTPPEVLTEIEDLEAEMN